MDSRTSPLIVGNNRVLQSYNKSAGFNPPLHGMYVDGNFPGHESAKKRNIEDGGAGMRRDIV